ncbi:MAG: DUF1801 domain-containing protein [Nesterenkonia sp.]|uniref:iron chaperone n=1 Tax=Nesterenkonia marinintestina TaxID=2979865 RepID=UPI0021BEB9CD|nr:DUF1801 domain-containing protein [Nesterenkonia sp. GX14115]MDO5493721.1 DUF1801 domain-containing protein [Nesterenkonia sp.]
MTTPEGPDDYVAEAAEHLRPSLVRLRDQLRRALPDAEEVVAYGMPGFRIDGVIVAGYAAFSRQCGLYVLPDSISQHAEEIAAAGLRATRTGVTFPPDRPIPDDLVERLVTASRSGLRQSDREPGRPGGSDGTTA